MASRITDYAQIRSFLTLDRDYAAYALGDLDPPYVEHTQWFRSERGGSTTGLALCYPVLEPPVLFLMGDSQSLSALLTECEFPNRVYFTAKPEFEALLGDFYTLEAAYQMYRMRVTIDTFVPFTSDEYQVVSLGIEQVDEVVELLQCAAVADKRAEGDIAFAPEMLHDGYYFGIYEQNRLIACAGTHIVATQSMIAAIGNVVVTPSHRGKRLGALVTSAVTSALLRDSYELVVLNVRQDNAPAVATYHKLGYFITGKFIEGLAER